MSRPPSSWRRRQYPKAWTPEEDKALADMIRCGLSVDYYALPGRSFGEILDRRLELVEAGAVAHPKAI